MKFYELLQTNLLTKRAEKNAGDLFKDKKHTGLASLVFLDNILLNNNLIPCWSEFAEIKPLITKNDALKPLEKAGKLVVTLSEPPFKIVVEFVIPASYPMQAAKMTIKESNFNKKFAEVFETQAQTVIKRLWKGMEAGYDRKIDINAGKIGMKRAVGGLQADFDKIEIASRSELKHDMDFIKKQNELKHGDMARADRRAFKLNIKHERQYEEEMALKADANKKNQDMINESGQINRVSAQPQLYHAINYLANFYVRFLPKAVCKICGCPLLVEEKDMVKKTKKKSKDEEDEVEMTPEQAYCGHWFHKRCFVDFVSKPPFNPECPEDDCKEPLASVDIPGDPAAVKQREKKFLMEQQKAGEQDDLDRLFGF